MAARPFDPARLMTGAALALLLAGCAPPQAEGPRSGPVPLPPMAGVGDPMRGAVTSAFYTFGDTSRVEGRPAEAARAVARLEWLATDLPADPSWNPAAPITDGMLRRGRDEVRDSIGIPRALPPDVVARAMIEAAAALDGGNRAAGATALAPVAGGGGGGAMLARLDHLPQSGQAATATAMSYGELIRLGRDTGLNE